MSWKPRPRADVDLRALPLSPVQGYVVSRLDGASDVAALAAVTGLSADRVEGLLRELVAAGAVEPERAPAPQEAGAQTFSPPPRDDGERVGVRGLQPAQAGGDGGGEGAGAAEQPGQADAAAENPDQDAAAVEPEPADPGTHRKLFETTLHHQEADARVALAKQVVEPNLSALCFDPLPSVIVALLDNPHLGLTQARLIARHHHTPQGLEALTARAAFAADGGVRRALLGNPQLPAGLFRRLWQGKRLLEQYQVTLSREVPEQTRRTAREVLRSRFATGPAEERVELIMKTEGRCLAQLVGLSVDSKTTSLLCARTYASTILIQNLARWSAAPPPLIAHLLRQELVRRNANLRQVLERHPNAPSGR